MGTGQENVIPIASLFPPPPWAQLPVLRYGGTGERTHIVCVYLHCDLLLFEPFLTSLPPPDDHAPRSGPSGQGFEANMRYLVAEAVGGRPGPRA